MDDLNLNLSQESCFQFAWDIEGTSTMMNFDLIDMGYTDILKSNLDSASVNDPNQHMTLAELMTSGNNISSNFQVNEDPSSSNAHYIPSSLPASQNWPGVHNFSVSFAQQEKNTKGVSWTYSKINDKLYVGKDAPCPINFSADSTLPEDVYIRAQPLFSSPEHASEVVRRCLTHTVEDSKKDVSEAAHLVRCESNVAKYEIDPVTGHQSVIVPYENPPAGQKYSTYLYKFACFGSCPGGLNRRPLMLIFSLEKKGQVIGRHKLDMKICSCPGRDRKNEEIALIGKKVAALPKKSSKSSLPPKNSESKTPLHEFFMPQLPSISPRKKSKRQPDENGRFVVKTHDEGCFNFLREMKKVYKFGKVLQDWPSIV